MGPIGLIASPVGRDTATNAVRVAIMNVKRLYRERTLKFQHDWTLDGEIKAIKREIRHGSAHRVNFRYAIFLLVIAFVMLAGSCYAGWECRSCGFYNLSDRVDYCGVCGSWNPNPRPRAAITLVVMQIYETEISNVTQNSETYGH